MPVIQAFILSALKFFAGKNYQQNENGIAADFPTQVVEIASEQRFKWL